jgi:hypothetical protein
MKHIALAALILTFLCAESFAQSTFEVTGTPLPATLMKQNYGKTPKGIAAYDLNICNSSGVKQSVVSSDLSGAGKVRSNAAADWATGGACFHSADSELEYAADRQYCVERGHGRADGIESTKGVGTVTGRDRSGHPIYAANERSAGEYDGRPVREVRGTGSGTGSGTGCGIVRGTDCVHGVRSRSQETSRFEFPRSLAGNSRAWGHTRIEMDGSADRPTLG